VTSATPAPDPIALLRGLRAVRHFRPDPVPDAALADMLEVARWTGSARNLQPWELVVVRDRATLDALADAEGYAKHLRGAPLGIVLAMHGDPAQAAQETYDEGRLAERLMLAAAHHGIGGSIGWWVGEGRERARELLGIPAGRLVRTVISFGYPDEEARKARPRPAQARKPLSEIVHLERYGRRHP
jgi:nitroreductase